MSVEDLHFQQQQQAMNNIRGSLWLGDVGRGGAEV